MSGATTDLQEEFEVLKTAWKSKTRYMSNSAQMAMVRPYQEIIGMGPRVLPLILKELERETDHWFWALETISREDPVAPDQAGKVEEMAKAWLDWGHEKGLI